MFEWVRFYLRSQLALLRFSTTTWLVVLALVVVWLLAIIAHNTGG